MDVTRSKRKSQRVKIKSSLRLQARNNLQDMDILSSSKPKTIPKESDSNKPLTNKTPEEYTNASDINDVTCNVLHSSDESKDYFLDLFGNAEKLDLNRKFYGCKKKKYLHNYSESFALPDEPIFSNTPALFEGRLKSQLDANSADPWDLSVLDLKLINQPWLVEYPEVITPYWDVDSLFPFEEIRTKVEPEFIETQNLNKNCNFSTENFENLSENLTTNVFTSTPLKKHKKSPLVSTINISNKSDKKVNISFLKDQVVKALEEAVKENNKLGNIDMKIKILSGNQKFDSEQNECYDGHILRSKRQIILKPNKLILSKKNNENTENETGIVELSSNQDNLQISKYTQRNLRSHSTLLQNSDLKPVAVNNSSFQTKKNVILSKKNGGRAIPKINNSDYSDTTKVLRSGHQISNIQSPENKPEPSIQEISNEIQASVREIIDKSINKRNLRSNPRVGDASPNIKIRSKNRSSPAENNISKSLVTDTSSNLNEFNINLSTPKILRSGTICSEDVLQPLANNIKQSNISPLKKKNAHIKSSGSKNDSNSLRKVNSSEPIKTTGTSFDSSPLKFRLGKQEDFQSELELVSVKKADGKLKQLFVNLEKVDVLLEIKDEIKDEFVDTGVGDSKKEHIDAKLNRVSAVDGEEDFNLPNIKIEETTYEPGDFVWAQVGKYPYWPAVICHDPEKKQHVNEVSFENKPAKQYYHIRFFGDKGRRAWILKKNLMSYCSKQDLDMIANKLKSENKNNQVIKHYLVNGPQVLINKWHKAIEELESVKNKKYEEVHAYLLNAMKNYRIYKEQINEERRRLRKSAELLRFKSNRSDNSTPSDLELKQTEFVRNSKSREIKQCNEDSKSHGEEISYQTDPSDNRDHYKLLRNGKESNSSSINSNSPVAKRKINNSSKYIEDDSDNENLLAKLKRRRVELLETESKASSSTSSSNSQLYSFEYQTELYRKNNLFNGLRNVKVCDYCLKQGLIFKCKGRCGNYFHTECASKVSTPRELFKKSRKVDLKDNLTPKPSVVKNKEQAAPTKDSITDSNQEQVQIITIKTKRSIETPQSNELPPLFHEMSLAEQIDYKMKELMSKCDSRSIYRHDSTDSSSEEMPTPRNGRYSSCGSSVNSTEALDDSLASSSKLDVDILKDSNNTICHVTADSVILTDNDPCTDPNNLKCTYCQLDVTPACFACGLEVSLKNIDVRRKCSHSRCTNYFHLACLKAWPQTQWSIAKWSKNHDTEDPFTCPSHMCHTCFSEDLSADSRLTRDKLARCMLCPATFHATSLCVPAGSEILGGTQIICPKHRTKPIQPINTIWCFICSEGGNLVCCDSCPTSVHPECQPITYTDDDKYICEDCESGRFPRYDEVVWVKLGQFRWWPALILFPNEIPANVQALKRHHGDFAVRFFGTHDHYWVNKSRAFLFQEGDKGSTEINRSKNKVYKLFEKAIEDAAIAFKLKREFRLRREAESCSNLKPPYYIKINKNKPVGNVKTLEMNLSNVTTCECNPRKPHPCGPDSDCINRLLMTECDPDICLAGSRCRNQAFQKREYMPVVPQKTQGRGWGLKCLTPISKGQFIIEYVGELIDTEEYQRRIMKMHAQKEENYYFMTVDSEKMIDAGPKGNLSRFINHSCNPNCITQKWTIRGETRVGIFSNCDIVAGSELTFNYNLEVAGQEKKMCKCGASNCAGFIGGKPKNEKPEKALSDQTTEIKQSLGRPRKSFKKKPASPIPVTIPPCFICNEEQADLTCNNKVCYKSYHTKCLNLEQTPDASKFLCPRHNCNICSNRTIRCCVRCINSFCPSHAETNVRHDKFLGFVCKLHDPEPSSMGNALTETSLNNPARLGKNNKEMLRLSKWRYNKTRRNTKFRLLTITRDKIIWTSKKLLGLNSKKSKNVSSSNSLSKGNKKQSEYVKYRKHKNNKKTVLTGEQFKPKAAKVSQENSPSQIFTDIERAKDMSSLNVTNVLSEQYIFTKSEKKPIKSHKRRRSSTLELTDESVVSSTTFDEDTTYNSSSHSTTCAVVDDASISQDIVTSSPLKHDENRSTKNKVRKERITRSMTSRCPRKKRKLNATVKGV